MSVNTYLFGSFYASQTIFPNWNYLKGYGECLFQPCKCERIHTRVSAGPCVYVWADVCMYTCTCVIGAPVITSQSRKLLPLDGAVLIKIPRSTCLSYLLLLLLPWHLKVSIMLLSFQVQCCVNGKSKNYVSFTYSYTSGTGKEAVGDTVGLVFFFFFF